MMKYLSKLICIIFSTIFISSCGTLKPGYVGNVDGFEKKLVKGGDFWVTTFQKITDKDAPYVFYIEGDGTAFYGKYQVSSDPTPRKPMLIQLATMDKRPNVVYIGRPCQYTPMELNPKCSPQYWTSKRMSEETVHAVNETIKNVNNNHKFNLIGFSGGGGIAVLVANKNPMVKSIVTIAANLDHSAFTRFHSVTPMLGSLNPIDYAEKIKSIPQLHISGANDTIVPPFIADKFVKKSASNCVKHKIYKDISHNKGWDKAWDEILALPVKCH